MKTTIESKSDYQVIAANQVRDSIYQAFRDAYTKWIDADKFLKIIEGGEINDEWGGEYTISLLQFNPSTDLIIWGNTGVDCEKEFDQFWILFSNNQKVEAIALLSELEYVFDKKYGSKGFKELLNEFLLNLETR